MAKKIREVLSMTHLSSTARLTYLWVCWTARRGASTATSSDLCELVGVGDDAITRAARELEAANLLRRERAGAKGKGNKRWVLIPALSLAIAGGTPQQVESRPLVLASGQAAGCSGIIDTQRSRRRRRKKRSDRTTLGLPSAA